MAGIYCADIYCDDCANDIRNRIAHELFIGSKFEGVNGDSTPDGFRDIGSFETLEDLTEYLEFMEGHDYYSDQYPKHYNDEEESDCPQHCGSGQDCINAEELDPFDKYGYFFGNNLTNEGDDYVKGIVNRCLETGDTDSPAVLLWMPFYDYINYVEKCTECKEYANLNDEDLCETCDTELHEPAEGDYIVTPGGTLGGKLAVSIVMGKFIGLFGEEDDAYDAIRKDMDANELWPNVWFVSGHGNASIVTM